MLVAFQMGHCAGHCRCASAIPYFHRRVDEEIRRAVLEKIAAHYSRLTVTLRSALLVEGEGIELRGLTI